MSSITLSQLQDTLALAIEQSGHTLSVEQQGLALAQMIRAMGEQTTGMNPATDQSKVNMTGRKARMLSTDPGTMTIGQEKRIRRVAKEHGVRVRINPNWSMAQASAYYSSKFEKQIAAQRAA